MIYLKCIDSVAFFEMVFAKDELITIKEYEKFLKAHKNRYALDFARKYFRAVEINKKNVGFTLGRRFMKV